MQKFSVRLLAQMKSTYIKIIHEHGAAMEQLLEYDVFLLIALGEHFSFLNVV